ncbi:MAG: twin-arginine translocase TatA/TatE family subunit [Planctomycetota bacterium]|nr:twin-arginine translocase TatA/TatE family subunit [Planctomycetota bacterium]
MSTLAFWMPGPWEMAIIAVVALLLFGRRLPEVGRSLGKGIVEFKKGLRDVQDEVTKATEEPPPPPKNPPQPPTTTTTN